MPTFVRWDRGHRRPKGPKPMVSVTVRGTVMVPFAVKVPEALRLEARREAFHAGVTLQDWVADALAEELERRRRRPLGA